MTMKKAFTLIELLIVVAIIAILAAIAVPNFLEAQTRAKVSRARTDLRTVATAIESYAVDNNRPPRMMHSTFYPGDNIGGNNVFGIVYPGGERNGVMQHGLSTPIAYLSTAWLQDPFVNAGDAIPDDEKTFTYQELEKYQEANPSSAFWQAATGHYGMWRMCSIGPDRVFNNNLGTGGVTSAQIEYDPTNGTLSAGNIWRSQRFSENGQPPIGPLMPAH